MSSTSALPRPHSAADDLRSVPSKSSCASPSADGTRSSGTACRPVAFGDDVDSRQRPGPPPDELLVPNSITGSGSLARGNYAGRRLLATVASHLGRVGSVRGLPRASGSRTRACLDRNRRFRGKRSRQAARPPSPPVLTLATEPDPHAAVDVLSLGAQRSSVRVRNGRQREVARARADPLSARRRGGILARLHGRSLPERRLGRRRHRDRLRRARCVFAGDHHFSSISSSRSSVTVAGKTAESYNSHMVTDPLSVARWLCRCRSPGRLRLSPSARVCAWSRRSP